MEFQDAFTRFVNICSVKAFSILLFLPSRAYPSVVCLAVSVISSALFSPFPVEQNVGPRCICLTLLKFRLLCKLFQNDYYNRPNAPNTIPVRWLAPEGVVIQKDGSLLTKPASSHGNVW